MSCFSWTFFNISLSHNADFISILISQQHKNKKLDWKHIIVSLAYISRKCIILYHFQASIFVFFVLSHPLREQRNLHSSPKTFPSLPTLTTRPYRFPSQRFTSPRPIQSVYFLLRTNNVNHQNFIKYIRKISNILQNL